MSEHTDVAVPRSLRVGSTVSLMGKRIPIKTTIISGVLIVVWAGIAFAGGDLFATGQVLIGVGVVASVIVEGRWGGGYTTLALLADCVKVMREPRYLDWQQRHIDIAADHAPTQAAVLRRPRWQNENIHVEGE